MQRPDVAVLDLQMPEMDGFAAIREIRRVAPEVAVLVLTMFDDEDSLFAAMRAGARGYVVKGAEQDEIDRAIRAVAAGEAIFSPGVAHRVLRYFAAPPPVADPFPELTAREREILDLLAAAPAEHRDRRPARAVAEDRGQPPLVDLHQAPGRRPGGSHPARQGRRDGRAPAAEVTGAMTPDLAGGGTCARSCSTCLLSLDGVAEEPGDWMTDFDQPIFDNLARVIGSQDTILLGRGTYDYWVDFWPGDGPEPFHSFINRHREARVHLAPARQGLGQHGGGRRLGRRPRPRPQGAATAATSVSTAASAWPGLSVPPA